MMAEYCPRCHRGSWACGCFISFAEKVGTVRPKLGKAKMPDMGEPDTSIYFPPKQEDVLAGDPRRGELMNFAERYAKEAKVYLPTEEVY